MGSEVVAWFTCLCIDSGMDVAECSIASWMNENFSPRSLVADVASEAVDTIMVRRSRVSSLGQQH